MKNKKRFIFGMVLILLIFSMGIFLQKSINRSVKLNKDDVMSLTEAEQIEVGKNSKITSATITQRKTGTGPWDDNDDAGNDMSEDNDIVRSFDQVTYTVEYTMGLKDGASVENYKGGAIEVKAELPEACANVVKWDTDSMAWMENAKVSSDGRTITGKYTMSSTEITVPGKQTLVFVLKVLGAPNKLTVQPTFISNLLGNDESEKVSIQDSVVTVSAAPNYNVRINRNEELSNKTTVDYGNGDTSGRMYGYGILLELYNQSQDKGLKGIEYPKGDISFDVNLKLERSGFETSELEDITEKCTPILWNYCINDAIPTPLISNRKVWTNGQVYFRVQRTYPLGVMRNDRTYTVKNSGNWKMTQNGSKISVNVNNYEFDGIFPIYQFGFEGAKREIPRFYENEGIFSVGYFQIFVPDNDESTIGDRNYYLTVNEKNMLATSSSGVTTQVQAKTDDDETRVQHVIYNPGYYEQVLYLQNADWTNMESNYNRGDASSNIGTTFKLEAKFVLNLKNDYDIYSASKFIKFDGDAFEPKLLSNNEKYMTLESGFYGTMKFHVWYVTKKDGTNWTSQSEMNNGNIEDMNLYENIEDIPDGYICIGEFFESTGGNLAVASGDNNSVYINLKIRDNAKVGQTYGITSRTKYWKETLDRSIYTITNKDAVYPQTEWDSGNRQYVKTEYNNGIMISGTHKGGANAGNTILVTGATLNIISKAIDESGNTKVNYDLGKNEYDVTYQLQPSLSNANLKTSITGVNLKIEETLPVGMTYVPGSCEYDEPEITKNSDGTTLLVWYKYNCTVGEKIEPIVYKAHISEETANGVQYQTKTVVEEIIGEGEVYKVGNSRIADRTYTTAINVINLSNYSVYKTTTTPMIELNGQIHYKVTFLNKTEDTVNDFQILDILPYSGDSRGSSFAGTYTVEKIDLKQTKSDETISNDNLKLYVTNSESVRTGVTVKDEDLGTSSIWTKVTSGQAINQINTAYAITGPIAGKTRLEVDIYLKTTGNKAEDVYKNTATVQTNKSTEAMQTSIITVQDIKRELSGKVWFDSNADGLMNNNEQMLEGVKLKLVNEDGSTAIDIDGNEIQPVLTDKNGYYEFENMVKGNYKVQVEVTDSEKEITLKGVGVNREINSNFNSDGSTDVITELNSAESPVLSEKNVNAGIKCKNTTVLVHHYIKGTTTKLSDDVTVNGKIYDEYTTSKASDIPEQYELVETPVNATGIMTKNQIVVTYYYQLKNYPYTVNYLEKNTNKVLHTAKQGDELVYGSTVTSSKEVINIDGYNYDSVDKDTLTIGTGENVINIYYTKRTDLSYKVNYLEKTTNKVLHEQKTQDGMTFDAEVKASDEVITINGYNYDSADKTSIKITTGENVINIYYTKRNDLSYTVNYLEKDTNKILHNPKNQTGMTFEDKIISADEVIDIDGYNYDSVDKDSLTITTGTNVINIYYTKRKDLSYKVNYLEKTTNKILHNQKVQDGMTFESVVKSSDEVISIDGYNYNSVDKDSLTITTGENVINIYYTKRTDLSYTVNYLEKTSNKVLHSAKTVENKTFGDVIKSADEKISIDGYNYDSVDKESLTITTGANIINIYYTKRSDLSYKVNYLEKTTNKVLHNQKTQDGMTFESVVTSANEVIEIDGYKYDSIDKDSLTITTGENVINIYYTKRTDLSYKVNYLEKGTDKVLHNQKVQDGMTFEDMVTSADEVIDIDGYKYDSVDKTSIKITTGENVINIYYTKVNGLSYTVNYLEKGTNEVINPAKTKDGMTFQDVVTSRDEIISIDGYDYDSVDKDTLTITTGENAINIYYTKRNDLSYIVNYLEKGTNKVLHDQKVQNNMTFESVVTSANEVIAIDGYNYNSVDKETLTIGTKENVINIYYTKRSDLSYKVNYLEKDTNKVLHDQKVQEGMAFESTVTSANEVIEIDGYNYDSVDKDSLTITTGENVINIYYTKRTDLSYKVNYLEKTTNKVLHDQKVQDDMTFENVVTSADEVIDIDGYNYDSVDKDTLTITTGENIINIYYTKRNDLSYTVNYLEKDTNIVLHEPKVTENMTFEMVINSDKEVIDIDGYNYDSVDKDTLVIETGKNIINIYYTKRNDLSYTVNYLEKGTNRTIHAPKVTQNMTFGTEITSSKEVIAINGYSYDSVDKDSLILTTGENVINIYYTKVVGLSYTVNYLEKDTNEVIHEPKTTDNMIFEDEITSNDEVIEIDGYDYDSVDKDKLVIGTGENVINIYYTKRIDLEYEVNFLEKGTNKVLSKAKIKTGMKFKDIVKSSDEVIEIDGYNFSDVDKDILEILTSGNVINIYYTKREDVSYKVNYLEKGTNKVLHEQKVQENMTFESVVNSTDEVIDIYGYNYDSADNESITLTTGENVINLYYTKKDTKVTVHYYEEGTTNKVSNDVEIPGKVFDNYETESASDIPSKYELVTEPENKNGTMTEDEITVIYYYRKKATQVIVHYYEENTTKKLSEDVTINGRVDDKYTTVLADDIPIKYELVAEPVNKSGSMTEETIEVIYYYRVKDAVVHVKYLEKGTNKVLADPDRLDGKVDDDYQTTPKVIDGYQLVEHTGNEKSKFEVEPLTITYYYLYKTKATVQYIDKITGQILEQSTTEGLEGDDFITESKDFENYVLVEEPAEKTVKMTKKEQVLKYYYIHVSGGVIEKHIDVISGQILANKTYEGNEGDAYDIPSRTFEGYDLVEDRLPSNSKGTMKVEPVEVIYYYIYRSKVTAEYIDKNTGNKLTDDVVQKGHEGDNYTTDRKTFDDYKLVEVPSNADGSMTKEDITVTYYYVHTSGGVIVNHIDIKTGKQLLDETKEEGYEGDSYETHEENIPEYDLVKEKYPENAVGKMTIEPTRVIYYYIKKTEVNVKYVDKETGEEIDEPTNIPGHEGDDYKTEPKDVPGYDLIEEPENKDGTMTADPIGVIYYYKRPAKVIVNYYDIDTKEKLADEIEITGHQNDDYTTEQKDIKYYEIAKTPENKEGKMIVTVTKDENGKEIVDDTTYVNYYYRKLIFNLRVDKTITSVIVNGQETLINGSLGKVEVHRKELSTANVKVVYKIKVTNDSELTGKANVVENIPSGMTMIADNNPEWTINETTASIETDEIKPGESREYQVVLGWQNGDNNIGTKENIASIITENEAGFEEKDKSDNESKADLIVAVGTGEVPYVAIAGSILLIMISITAGIYVIKKKHE